MLICSELPRCMMLLNNDLNEYDFVLFHMYEKDEEYRRFYLSLRQTHPSRTMIFDNSAYEYFVTGQRLDVHAFIKACIELKPDYVIAPDVLMDKDKTLKGTSNFMTYWKRDAERFCDYTEVIGVMQGNSMQDLLECAQEFTKLGITSIAMPFHNSFFKDVMYPMVDPSIEDEWKCYFGTITEDHKYAIGRVMFTKLYQRYLCGFEHLHFLGSHCPYEKVYLQKMFDGAYATMDTAYPVKVGYMGISLFAEKSKPEVIIDEIFDEQLPPPIINVISENIKKFKEL